MSGTGAAPKLAPLGAEFRAQAMAQVRQRLSAAGLEAALFLLPANILYLTGWSFSVNERPMGLLVHVDKTPVLFVPELERENAEPIRGVTVKTYEEFPGEVPAVLWMVAQAKVRRLAIDTLDARHYAALTNELETLSLKDFAAPSRYIKSAEEIALTREAARFADLCLERLLAKGGELIAQGASELDLFADCTGFARKALLDIHGPAFLGTKLGISASVHSGPRAALPHGATGTRVPQAGDTLICGVGASLGGYHAESGITLIVGDISAEQRRVMTAMQACNDAAVAALVPGTSCAFVNRAALAELSAAGLGDAIRHRIGHGMGVEGHEAPWLAPGDDTPVAQGMVFSNEPGVYRPGRDGYRTINTMIVGPNGVEIPSRFQADHPIDTRVLALA